MEDPADRLDILGEQAGLFKLYTQLCLCFRMNDSSSRSDIINTLTQGLEKLTASYPWVAGQVVNSKPDHYRIAPYENIPRLIVKDDASLPTMEALRQSQFPFSMLDESLIAPMATLAAGTDGPAPILLLQANFVKNGLLLTIVTQHNVMDMTGQAQIMHLLSKACHGEPFHPEELRTGNLERHNLIRLLDSSDPPLPELAHQTVRPTATPPIPASSRGQETTPDAPECLWTYFLFSGPCLADLKSLAMKSVDTTAGFVSTDDVLSAFIWQGVMKARLPRLNTAEKATFARAIDPRRYLGLPATYPGLIQNMVRSTYTLDQLLNEPLGKIASRLREAVDPNTADLGFATRALTTKFHLAEDKSIITVVANLDFGRDIMLSSWAKYGCYDLDFNLGLEKPEEVRRPGFTPVESLFYLMPKRPDGEIAAALCLRREDLERLKVDEGFMRYAVFVG